MTRTFTKTLALLSIPAILLIAACRPVPKAGEVRAAVGAYFSGRGYPVVELSIRDIRPLEDREKTYMGVPAFVVELDSLVLDVAKQHRTFRDVKLLLKRSRSQEARYVVSDISGVPLP